MKDYLKEFEEKYPQGTILKHKQCNIKMQVLKYHEDLFGTYVDLKVKDKIIENKYHYYGLKQTYYIDILKEYKIYN